MLVRFIAHAGIFIQEEDTSLLIDPWFTDSTRQEPIVEGLSGKTTIDFQIPKCMEDVSEYRPDGILLSHFHPHHASSRDIFTILKNNKETQLAFPSGKDTQAVTQRMSEYPNASIKPMRDGESFFVGKFKILALDHTAKGHLAWFVEGATGKILHIADAKANKKYNTAEQDAVWNKFFNLKPDIVFLSAGRNSFRMRNKETGEKEVREATCLSPIQGSKIVHLIAPKAVSVIGMYNHSIWKNRLEYIPPPAQIEEEFEWSLSWLNPSIKFIRMYPGHRIGINDTLLATDVDTYIK